tara:strand:- start:2520 stop:3776 length:1257 start_codon:yes stop_codon:yes gene_type:complete
MDTNEVKTYGCRLNFYESEVIRKFAKKQNISNSTFINGCAVTNKTIADLKSEIRKIKREKPDRKIVLTGCAAQIHQEEFSKMSEIDAIIGNKEKLEEKTYERLRTANDKVNEVGDILQESQAIAPIIDKVEQRIRGFVQIQNGCDHRCTFCIIPYGRGNSRSVKPNNVVKQIKNLLEKNYKEVVLTGVDLTSYGHDFEDKKTITDLVKLIFSEVPNLKRLRLSSLDIAEIDDDLTNLIGTEKRILPHIHLSLQAGDNMILKRMKRRHLREDAINKINKIRSVRPDVVFGADLIAGFPTETEEMFNNTIKLVEECNISFLHVFPFSPREGTPASRMPQLNREIIKKRAKILRELGNEQILKYYNKLENTEINLIVESESRGRSDGFAKVNLNRDYGNGNLIKMLVTGSDSSGLSGNIIV